MPLDGSSVIRILKRGLLSAWLVASAPAFADDLGLGIPSKTPPRLLGSEKTLRTIEPFKKYFMRLSGKDTVVFSSSDLIKPQEEKDLKIYQSLGLNILKLIPPEERKKRFLNLLEKNKQHLPDLYILKEYQALLVDTYIDMYFLRIAKGNASAQHFKNTLTNREVCNVVTWAERDTSENLLRSLANMPDNRYFRLTNSIEYVYAYAYVLLHEARHCGQKINFDGKSQLDINIIKLENETDADLAALKSLKEFVKDTIIQQEFDYLVHAVRASRAISSIREGQHLLSSEQDFSTHITHVFAPEDKVDFKYDAADITLGAKILNSIVNFYTGSQWGPAMKDQNHSLVRDIVKEIDLGILNNDIFGFIRNHIEIGRNINLKHPELQYGVIKSFNEELFEMDKIFEDKSIPLYTAFKIMKKMSDNYIQAMEEFFPDVTNSPLAKNVYQKTKDDITKAKNTPSKPLQEAPVSPVYGPPAPELKTSKDVLEFFVKLQAEIDKPQPKFTPPPSSPSKAPVFP